MNMTQAQMPGLQQEASPYRANQDCCGMIKVWQFDPVTGTSRLLHDTRNMIVYTGADLLAFALAGRPNCGISHINLGYNNGADFDVEAEPAVTASSGGMKTSGDYGYVRVPLTFPASFRAETHYENNSVFFTVMLTNPPSTHVGAEFGATSKLYTIGLVAALNPSGSNQDKIFSRAQFTPITYDPAFGLTVTWGVKFTAVTA